LITYISLLKNINKIGEPKTPYHENEPMEEEVAEGEGPNSDDDINSNRLIN